MPELDTLFDSYEQSIRELPARRPLVASDVLTPHFRLEQAGRLEVYYAPIDWIRLTARVAIVGITPGKDTAVIAYETAADRLAAGATADEALCAVKSAAPFSGFRALLTQWLDYLEVPRHLQLNGSQALWTSDGESYLHSTSAVRYPVFVASRNYSGRSPDLVEDEILRGYVLDVLAPELAAIPNALVIPLGKAVNTATDLLVRRGLLDAGRCLSGFPHPSGSNGHKTREWAASKDGLRIKVSEWFRRHPAHA